LHNLPGLDFIPAGVIKGEKEIKRENMTSWNKSGAGRVYHPEHVHIRRGLAPLSL
jgi:hypothetical protein